METYQHGDVIVRGYSGDDARYIRERNSHLQWERVKTPALIEVGEATGHMHEITQVIDTRTNQPAEFDAVLGSDGKLRFAEIPLWCLGTVAHTNDHESRTLPPGVYDFTGRVQQSDPFSGLSGRVYD